jgi:4'-phosphopantetheinyl transferase EntD
VNPDGTVPEFVERTAFALESIAPSWIRTGVRLIDDHDEVDLWPKERSAVTGAVAVRRAEFATGRALLRSLIGVDVEIPVRSDRRPEFPDGVVGTLAHDRRIAVAAIATRPTCRALGIDVEPAIELGEDVARLICRPEERHLDTHLVFVLKEAAYKAWSSMGGRILVHDEVVVTVDTSVSAFDATVIADGVRFAGKYTLVDDRWLALVVVDEADRAEPARTRV